MMQRASIGSILVSAFLATSLAHAAESNDIPSKIKDKLLKLHPQATELRAEPAKHFNNDLIKVSYKDNDEVSMALFRANGSLYSNILLVEDPTPFPEALLKAVKNEFAHYEFKKAELVVNPNGIGEEYDLFLVADGVNWLLSVDDKGRILGKRNY